MNFGQMLMWHIVLMPIVLVAIIGAHVLLVRVRGVIAPAAARPACRGGTARQRAARGRPTPHPGAARPAATTSSRKAPSPAWSSWRSPWAWPACSSSPDVPSVTVQSWARVAPADFLATAASELNGTSETATYGPPYNNGTGSVQSLLFSPAAWPGSPSQSTRPGLRARAR